MFENKTKELINEAVIIEIKNATSKHGEKYNTTHEAYGVLKEEIEEAFDEMSGIFNGLENIWEHIKKDTVLSHDITVIQNKAIFAALECCQIAAVCEKFKNSIQEG